MTDIFITAPITRSSIARPGQAAPKSNIGAAFLAVCEVIGQAYAMAYATPFGFARRQPTVCDEADLQGRDPKW